MAGKILKYTTLLLIMVTTSCSNKKNTVVSRASNNLTSQYNIYFNGYESFKKGVEQVNSVFIDNYSAVLPVFKYGSQESASSAAGNMDRALKKCSKVIALHSIKVKPKRDKGKMSPKQLEYYQRKDFNNWIDDCYLLMGKSHFYLHDFEQATKAFDYILREYKNNNQLRYETQLWLAKTYNETQNYKDAGPLLEQLEKDYKFPKKFKDELYSTYADYFLKQGKYEESVPKLKLAIDKEKKKKLRARYQFILAQVYEQLKEDNKAYSSYSEVIKMNPPYEMAFNAKIKRANLVNATNNKGGDVKTELNRMLKDAKNIDFLDQIYYALGKIALKEGKKDEAIELFTSSVKSSTTNSNQKGLSCIALADLHFEKNNYEPAKTYYDSALVSLNESYPGYAEIYKETKTLNRLVTGLNTVEVEDSLQKIALMPARDRDNWVAAQVELARKEEERIREEQQSEREGNYLLNRMTTTQYTSTTKSTEGGWYFYNVTTKSFGIQDFQRKWGKRILEDNWRRKNKQNLSSDEEVAEEETEETETTEDELIGRRKESKFGKTENNYYLENVPLSDSLMQVSHSLIKKALLVVGEIYFKDLKNYDKAIKAFEELNSRYPNNEFLLESYYNLYQLYLLKGDIAIANRYKQSIVDKFPESTFALVLTNPDYFKELEEEKIKVNAFYENTYQSYLDKNYPLVIQNCEYAENNYKRSDLKSKFSYLKSLAIGCTSDARTLKAKLNEFIIQYPKSKEKKSAENILAYIETMGLKTDFYENLQVEAKTDEAKKDVVEKDTASLDIYKYEAGVQHLFAILINTKTVNDNQLIFNIINHNVDYFPEFDFNTTSEILNDNYKIITVKYFNDKEQAMAYYNSMLKDKDLLSGLNEQDFKYFVISNKNFTIFLKEKSLTEYLDFFKSSYF